ncbi:hypothetical protein TSUD_316010 [Trifolium subterraneum]|uniref:Cysteine-rich transmembrane CYSTM domain-containing protein n=1 Tax=Trifolium subterraneum TaxID=3900 RepID=A0A2Z6MEJ5_TRISU|nr:hypothetical protein TSUD_316010 [Trifolium subterraneum]
MAYYNQNPPAVNVNVSGPPPGQAGYPQPGYQGYPPPPPPAPQPQVFVTQAPPPQAANTGVAETALLGCVAAAVWRRLVVCCVLDLCSHEEFPCLLIDERL